jgi:tetratricopeptide (TPR) repeat protein
VLAEPLNSDERLQTSIELATYYDLTRQLAEAGQRDQALQIMDELISSAPAPFKALVQAAEIEVHLALEDAQAAEQAAGELDATVEALGVELLRFKWLEYMGRIRELQADLAAAADFYRRRIEQSPTGTRALLNLGRCYRKMGKLDQAQEVPKLALLRSPYHPLGLFELAQVEDAQGHRRQATEHLRRSLEVWAQADSTFAPAREAREKLHAWTVAG